jgi:hypothetical protein
MQNYSRIPLFFSALLGMANAWIGTDGTAQFYTSSDTVNMVCMFKVELTLTGTTYSSLANTLAVNFITDYNYYYS